MMHLHASGRIEDLALGLAEVLQANPLDPMQAEWVAVPSDGIRRWLALELARHLGADHFGRTDGISAHITFPFPGSLRQRVLNAGQDDDGNDPWAIDRLAWMVLAAISGHRSDPELRSFATLAPGASLYGKARRVADLFDRYHVHRPAMVREWALGHLVDGSGRSIPDHHAWQPYLWRVVRDLVGVSSPPERMPDLLAQLSTGSLVLDLPDRLSVFGVTSLPGGNQFLELSRAVAEGRELHLFLLETTPLSQDAVQAWKRTTSDVGYYLRSDDSAAEAIHHPLLRTWGRLQRETSLLLAGERNEHSVLPQRVVATDGVTVLQQLQADIRANRAPSGQLQVDPSDRSIQMHACFGLTRQVEVVRDAILHLLNDPTLGLLEDDILVVSPALSRTAALVEAVFGPSVPAPSDVGALPRSTGQAPGLRYRIADRSVRDFNQVLSAVGELIDVIGGRFEASTVLDFTSLLPVRTRFRFNDDDLAQINEWVESAYVRWGWDPVQRSRYGLPATVETNTWQQALDRLLLGSAVFDADTGLALGELPVIGVEGSDVDTLGRLAELLRCLADLSEETLRPRPMTQWLDLLRVAATELLAVPDEVQWQMTALWALLSDVEDSVPTGTSWGETDLPFSDVRKVFGDRLSAAPGRPDFFRGGVTVSSFTPLRGIPFRVVCLLGMDESAFGGLSVDGDDLAAVAPVMGDPDSRSEVRLSLLEAVMAAQDRLIVVRDGHDVRTNQEIKPAVVVQELADAVLATVQPESRKDFADRLEIQHPRQSFDQRCFVAGTLGETGPWGFAAADLAGAQAARAREGGTPPFLASPLPPEVAADIDLNDVRRFMRNPVRWFFEHRLGALLPRNDATPGDRLPVALDSLEKWHLGDRMLTALLRGVPIEDWVRIEYRRGTLPNHSLGEALLQEFKSIVPDLVAAAEGSGVSLRASGALPVDVALPDGTRLFGTIANRFEDPEGGPARILYSKAKSHQRVEASIDLLALVATEPDRLWRSLVVSRVEKKPPHVVDLLAREGDEGPRTTALAALSVIVDCYRRGCREPLPLFPNLSPEVYGGSASATDWRSFGQRADGDDPTVSLVYGDYDFHSLMELPARADDPAGSGGRVERYANYVFGALKDAVGDRS